MDLEQMLEMAGKGVDVAGAGIVIIGLVMVTIIFLRRVGRGGSTLAYTEYRQGIGRAILLGLEFLVAGDIIRTVAVDPTLRSVLVLGIIVLIRTFLSMA